MRVNVQYYGQFIRIIVNNGVKKECSVSISAMPFYMYIYDACLFAIIIIININSVY